MAAVCYASDSSAVACCDTSFSAQSSAPAEPAPLLAARARVIALDIALKHNGLVHMVVYADPRADADPLLRGYAFDVLSFEVLDVLTAGASTELAALGVAADDVDANALSVEDSVMLHVRATAPRIAELAACTEASMVAGTDLDGVPAALRAVLIESQPMGGGGGGGGGRSFAAASAQMTRNVRTKCCSHAVQGALHMLEQTARVPVRFVSPQIKAQDFGVLGRGPPADYAQRKQFGVLVSRRMLSAVLAAQRGLELSSADLDDGSAEVLVPQLQRACLVTSDGEPANGTVALLLALLKHKRQRGVHASKKDDVCDALLEGYYATREMLRGDAVAAAQVARAETRAAALLAKDERKRQREAKRLVRAVSGKKRAVSSAEAATTAPAVPIQVGAETTSDATAPSTASAPRDLLPAAAPAPAPATAALKALRKRFRLKKSAGTARPPKVTKKAALAQAAAAIDYLLL